MKLFNKYFNGVLEGYFHESSAGVDFSKPVGLVVYFDGDYYEDDGSDSSLHNFEDDILKDLAKVANERNMVFVSPMVPEDSYDKDDGYTWWLNMGDNGDWIRSLLTDWFSKNEKVSKGDVWLVGYSGGAEFISYELLYTEPGEWMNGGGALMVGGGGSQGNFVDLSQETLDTLQLRWVVGLEDVAGATYPEDWSALDTAREAMVQFYKAGFRNTEILELNGVNHMSYDLPMHLLTFLDERRTTR